MHFLIYLLTLGCCNAHFQSFYKSTIDASVNFVKVFENIGYQMCASECNYLSACNSIVYRHENLQCLLYNVTCEDAKIQNSEATTFGCYKQKSSLCGSCKSFETCVIVSSSISVCIATECETQPIVRNADIKQREFDPPVNWYACKTGYTNSGSENKTTCKPGAKWESMDMRCYLPGIEEPNPVTYGNCIKSPSYVSNWLTIESQTSNSEIYIAHTCQDDPIKVEAQVKSQASSPYSDYVFDGINSALRDDDSGRTYGGVIVLYNASHVRLVAPKGANDGTAGSVIYTGGSNWHGPYDRTENVADVRVKVWCAADFKTPSFESTWIKINSTGPHFHEISHNLGEEIQLVTVQIKHESSSWIVGGIGSSSATTYSHYDNYGGVIYGYSNDNVRLWLPKSAPVFDMSDGWGLPSSDYTRWFSGSVKVRLWTKADLGFAMEKISIGTSNILNTVILPDHADLNNDFVYVSTFVNSGNNQGFSFPADSSVQESEAGTTFGSVVYAHSSSRLFVWQPIHTGGGAGYLVYIGNRWGETSYEQYSNTGTLQVSVIKTANQCKA